MERGQGFYRRERGASRSAWCSSPVVVMGSIVAWHESSWPSVAHRAWVDARTVAPVEAGGARASCRDAADACGNMDLLGVLAGKIPYWAHLAREGALRQLVERAAWEGAMERPTVLRRGEVVEPSVQLPIRAARVACTPARVERVYTVLERPRASRIDIFG